jgi:hypothetical protein
MPVISDDELNAMRGQVAAPPPPAEEPLDIEALRAQADSEDNEVLRRIFEMKEAEPNREAAIIKLARETGHKYDDIAPNFDEISRSWEAAKKDPARFKKEKPILADLFLRNPLLGKMVERDEKLSAFTKGLRAYDKIEDYAAKMEALGFGAGGTPEDIRANTFRRPRPSRRARFRCPLLRRRRNSSRHRSG